MIGLHRVCTCYSSHLGCTSAIEAPDSVRKRRAGRRAWAGCLLWRGPHPYLSQARFAGCSLRRSACLPPSPPSPLSTEHPDFSEPSGRKSNKALYSGLNIVSTEQGQASEVPVLRYSERSIRWPAYGFPARLCGPAMPCPRSAAGAVGTEESVGGVAVLLRFAKASR